MHVLLIHIMITMINVKLKLNYFEAHMKITFASMTGLSCDLTLDQNIINQAI